MKQTDARPLAPNEQILVAKVAAALAEYRGEPPDARHKQIAVRLLRTVLRGATNKRQPEVDSLVG